jgi:hypothetical protein
VEEQRDGLIASPDGKPMVLNFRLRPRPDTPAGAKAPGAEKRRAFSGFVYRPDGKPAASVVVRWGYMPYTGVEQTETDAAGRYRKVVLVSRIGLAAMGVVSPVGPCIVPCCGGVPHESGT